jgi:hypothetical protein
MTLLFSGRWDRPHFAHAITFKRLAEQYDTIKLVLLNYAEQEYSVAYRKQLLEEITAGMKGNFEIYVNCTHFGKITRQELEIFQPWDVYGSGNMEVLLHIEKLGYKTVYVERAYDYAATDDRTMRRIREVLAK